MVRSPIALLKIGGETKTAMKRIERSSESGNTIDFKHAPLVEIELGESFTVKDGRCAVGLYRSLDDAARQVGPWYWNYSPLWQTR